MSRILAVKGTVLPATLSDVVLMAEMEDGSIVSGEANISEANGKIKRLRLHPEDPCPFRSSMEIENADVIAIGPGSLYTSVIPNLLALQGIREAIERSNAQKVYVCNIMTQPGKPITIPRFLTI